MAAKKKKDEKIPAGDPRLRRMWAGIAVNALERGNTGHYDTISREVGAPSAKKLEEEGWIVAVRSFEVYKMITVNATPKPGERRLSRPPGDEIRQAVLDWLNSRTDDELRVDMTVHNDRSIYKVGDGPVVETSTTDEQTAHAVEERSNNDDEQGEDREGGQVGAGRAADRDGRFAPAA